MATQLKMFDGAPGNTLGESLVVTKSISNLSLNLPQSIELEQKFELEELLENIDGGVDELLHKEFDLPEVAEVIDRELSNATPLPPPVQPIRFVSESHTSPLHPNPYDPDCHPSNWTRIWMFFLRK